MNKDGDSEAPDATSGDKLVVTQQLKRKYHWKIVKKLTGDNTEESMLAASPFGEFFLFVCLCSLLICHNFIAIDHRINALKCGATEKY